MGGGALFINSGDVTLNNTSLSFLIMNHKMKEVEP
jgi:hypothetical protein